MPTCPHSSRNSGLKRMAVFCNPRTPDASGRCKPICCLAMRRRALPGGRVDPAHGQHGLVGGQPDQRHRRCRAGRARGERGRPADGAADGDAEAAEAAEAAALLPLPLPPLAGHAMVAWGSKLLVLGGHMKVGCLYAAP